MGTLASDRAIDLLISLARDGARSSLGIHAATLNLPISTAHRMVAMLVRRGLLAPVGRGRYLAGLELSNMAIYADRHMILAAVSRPLLKRLARDTGATAHLGIWDGDMVTYLVKESATGSHIFTREGGQLEGYCSAIGKLLLAYLSPDRLDDYLASDPFVALTVHTLTKPSQISSAVVDAAKKGFAVDRQEIALGLFCIAVPVCRANGEVVAAISLSGLPETVSTNGPPEQLRRCAEIINKKLG